MLKLIPPGKRMRHGRPNEFYIARGTVGDRRFEISTETTDEAEARSFADAFAVAVERNMATSQSVSSLATARMTKPISEILTLNVRPTSGVYFLFERKALLYVGQSIRIPARVKQHREDKRIPFGYWRSIACADVDMDLLEAAYIHRFRPPYNRGAARYRFREQRGILGPEVRKDQ